MADEDEIELPDQGDNIIRTLDPDVVINPKGLANEIFVCMKRYANKIGQIDAETGKSETFEEILKRSVRVAVNLRKHGVNPKDIVTLCSTNHLNTLVVFYATLFVGAIPANIDPFDPDDDRKAQLKIIEPKFVFAILEAVDKLDSMIKELGLSTKIVVFGCTCIWAYAHISFKRFLVESVEDEKKFSPYEVADLYDTATIVFSSGTTGIQKGICLHHYGYLTVMAALAKQSVTGFFSFAPMAWFSAIICSLMETLSGLTKHLCNGFTPEKTWRYLYQYKPTSISMPPHDYMALIRSKKPEELYLPHIAILIAGGEISLQSRKECVKFFPNSIIFAGYTQTELTSMCLNIRRTRVALEIFKRKPMMCGMPVKGLTYKIVDPDTEQILGPNQVGELCVKSKYVMNGYYKMTCHDRFDKDGYLKTGDMLYYDEEHCFFFVERLTEVLKYKMCTIAPLELENILMDHPSVKIAVVLGKPTDEGDLAFAVVVKNDDGVTSEELEELVAKKVDDVKRLRAGIVFVKEQEVLFTPSGKVRRRTLRKHILNNYQL